MSRHKTNKVVYDFKLDIPKHGHSGYTNYGCRCQECRDAATAYQVKYQRILKERELRKR